MEKISLNITTRSNLLIAGMPKTFEIGGIDMETITDYKGKPIIPASSIKGVLKRIVRDMQADGDIDAADIGQAYKKYIELLMIECTESMAEKSLEDERCEALKKRFADTINNASAEYLFGIKGFNDTPRLIFKDFVLAQADMANWYSIDTKNKIELINNKPEATPRTYKTVRPDLTFRGEIILHRMDCLNVEGIKAFVRQALLQFNQGIYRLGNSGSRGYGLIEVTFDGE